MKAKEPYYMFKKSVIFILGLMFISQVGYGEEVLDNSSAQIENTQIQKNPQYEKYVAIYKRLQKTYPQASKEEIKNYALEILQEKNTVDQENEYNKKYSEVKHSLENVEN